MRTKNLARGATVVFALAMLTVYVVGSQRRHNQGAFVLNVKGDSATLRGTAGPRGMVAYGSKSGPVFVPETPPATTNAAKATNSTKAKKPSATTNSKPGQIILLGTNSTSSVAAYVRDVRVLRTDEVFISSSKSAVVFSPKDVKFFTPTNGIAVNPKGK